MPNKKHLIFCMLNHLSDLVHYSLFWCSPSTALARTALGPLGNERKHILTRDQAEDLASAFST